MLRATLLHVHDLSEDQIVHVATLALEVLEAAEAAEGAEGAAQAPCALSLDADQADGLLDLCVSCNRRCAPPSFNFFFSGGGGVVVLWTHSGVLLRASPHKAPLGSKF